MKQGLVSWERCLERNEELRESLEALVGGDGEKGEKEGEEEHHTPHVDGHDGHDGEDSEEAVLASFEEEADRSLSQSRLALEHARRGGEQDSFAEKVLDPGDRQLDADGQDGEDEETVVASFEGTADLWLSQSRLALEHALLGIGVRQDFFPTRRPLLVFGTQRRNVAVPTCHRVEVRPKEGWPRRLHGADPLPASAAAKLLASSTVRNDETVAVEVPNPLLPRGRWIVIWPELKVLSGPAAKTSELPESAQVRRVVWCVNRKQIGRRDVISWLSDFWPDTPVRVALSRAAAFADGEADESDRFRVLVKVNRALEKFERITSLPWVVVGP